MHEISTVFFLEAQIFCLKPISRVRSRANPSQELQHLFYDVSITDKVWITGDDLETNEGANLAEYQVALERHVEESGLWPSASVGQQQRP